VDPLGHHLSDAEELRFLRDLDAQQTSFVAWRDPEGTLQILELEALRSPFAIGFDAENDIRLDWDDEVSGVHAVLEAAGTRWHLGDDGLSSNGTFHVDGGTEELIRLRYLRDGDLFRLGQTFIVARLHRTSTRRTKIAAAAGARAFTMSDERRRVLIELCRPYFDQVVSAPQPTPSKAIAGTLHIAERTVKYHLDHLYKGLDIDVDDKRGELVRIARERHLVTRRDYA
jgi:pSer/pThr/pTyr-binding forkhead associated (FHA) protein